MPPGATRARWIVLLRRCHIWTGLFAFTGLVVFAVAGLHVSFASASAAAGRAVSVREIAYRAPGDLTDQALAARIHADLRLPLTRPLPAWAVRRDRQHRLRLDFHTPNGVRRVTVLEAEGKLRIEHRRNRFGEFLSLMHARTLYGSPADVPLRLWALYVDLSMFALLFLVASGIGLWLVSRPGLGWARGALALGSALFAGIWWLLR